MRMKEHFIFLESKPFKKEEKCTVGLGKKEQ
jgi:hypothetical protein